MNCKIKRPSFQQSAPNTMLLDAIYNRKSKNNHSKPAHQSIIVIGEIYKPGGREKKLKILLPQWFHLK